MIRVSLVIWLIVAGGVAVGLYHVTYEARELEERLKQVRLDIEQEREALHVLEAEWSYLNRPARLARLAREHLDMRPLQPDQIVRVGQLPPRVTRPMTPPEEDAPTADGIPLPRHKPWSLRPQISQAITPFSPEADQ